MSLEQFEVIVRIIAEFAIIFGAVVPIFRR
jgi:hypothetical protein